MSNLVADLKGLRGNSVNSISFDLKAKGHRGYQDFIVYPINRESKSILVQSSKRIGNYYPQSGKFLLSKSRQGGSYSPHLIIDPLTEVVLSEEQRKEFNEVIEKFAPKGSVLLFGKK